MIRFLQPAMAGACAFVACTDTVEPTNPDAPTEVPPEVVEAKYLVLGGVFTSEGLFGYGAVVDEVT